MNLIKDKQCSKIKGQKCDGGSTLRGYIPMKDALLLTISLEALMATLVVDAYEGQDVTIFDVPGAYLNADIPD